MNIINRITFLHVLAALWSLFSMAYVTAITFGSIPTTGTRFADTVLGFLLGTAISSILSYFFGSSQGSKSKDGIISNLAAPSAQVPLPPTPTDSTQPTTGAN